MKYGIASYKRPECRTVKTLLEAGVAGEDIIISVQSEQDYKSYSEKHNVKIIYAENDCAGGNRNNILKNVEGDLILLDDDITSFAYWDGKKFIANTQKVLSMINEDLAKIEDDVAIIGISPSANGLVRKGRPDLSYLTLLQGTFLIFKDKSIFFDEKWKMVEDYEISLNAIHSGKTTLRLNNYVANKPKNGTNKGGLHDRYVNNELPIWITRLAKKYKEFIPNKDKTGGRVKL